MKRHTGIFILLGPTDSGERVFFPGLVTIAALLVLLALAPLGTAFGQEPAPSDPGMDVPQVLEVLGSVVEPEGETDPLAESPVTEVSIDKTPENAEPESAAPKAGGAQATPLSFQIPTSPQATVDQATGALVFEYPIELPEGRAGLKPELVLRYNSRDLTKLDSIAGLGWELSIPYIQREPIQGTQHLYAKPFFSSSINGNLVATTDTNSNPYTTYRPESDDGSYLKYAFNSDNSWTVTGKDGRTYTFGGSAASRQDNPTDSSKVYRWMVSKIADTHGNEIQYSYFKDQGQIYLSQIAYAYHISSPAVHTVSFLYTTSPVYPAPLYNAAFAVVTAKLLTTITVTTSIGGDTTTDSYALSYEDAQFLDQKLLTSITRTTSFARSEYNQSFNDTTTFVYSTKAPGWEQGTHSLQGYLAYSDDTIFSDIYTADFDLNGYADVFVSYRYRTAISNYLLLNTGPQFTNVTTAWALPTNIDLSYQYAVADLNGDHLPDLHPRNLDLPNPPVYLNTGLGFVPDSSGVWFMGNYVSEARFCGPNVGDTTSYSTNTFLYDINRDGKNDIVHFGGASNFKVYLNNGSGWTQSAAYTFSIAPGSTYDFSRNCHLSNPRDNFQALLDLNGDGLEDYVHAAFGTYLNTGSGFAHSAAYSLDIVEMERSGLADINGDSLVDYVSFRNYDGRNRCARVFLNNGAGFTLANPATFPPCEPSNVWTPHELKYTVNNPATFGTLMDVTADGLPDIVGPFYQSTLGKMRAINDGRRAWAANSNVGDQWRPIVTPSHGVFFDINTDGVLDFIAPETVWDGEQQSVSKVYMGKSAVPNRLVQITSALGAQTLVEYGTAPTNHSDTNISPMPVVKKLAVENIGHGQPARVVRYAYAGGAYTADPATGHRRFAGFHRVTATESGSDLSALRVTDTYFYQANGADSATSEPADTSLALIGKPYYTVVRHPSGNPKRETWQRYGTHTLTTEPGIGRLSTFSYPTEVITKTTEMSATTSTAELYTYDTTLGERLEMRQLGFVTADAGGAYTDIPGDTRYRFTEYATNASGTIVKPSRIDIRTSPSTEDTIARTEYFYDSQPLGGMGFRGNLTKELVWISGNGAVVAENFYTHDDFGNVLTATNPRGALTVYTYDPTKSHVATETNALGHTTAYEFLSGKLKKVTDPNGGVTAYAYSNKGWLYRTTTAKTAGNQRTRQVLNREYSVWVIESGQQLINAREDLSWQSIDNLGRPIRRVRRLLNHTTGDTGGFYLKEARTYDVLGREIARSSPYGVSDPSGSNILSVSVPAALTTTTTYDIFDRPLTVATALGTTTLSYAGPETITTDANGKSKRTKADAYGNLVEVKEYNGTSEYTTRYAYDVRDLLTGVTDALGNVRSFTYNHAGWLINSQDLHAPGDALFGITAFTYDAAGNQLTETQPNGAVVTRVFDLLNRSISIDGSTTAAIDFTLTYDSCTKGIGRLCGVSGTFPNYGLTLTKSFVYGASTPVSTAVTTLGNTYTTAYEYTLADEVTRITHPNGTVVRYVFDDWALPTKVYTTLPGGSEALFATTVYHHTLQPETITFANGPTLSYAYDSGKLYRPQSFSAVANGTTYQSYAYSYENLNNLTQVVEPGLTKTYGYDDLYRLIQAVHTPSVGSSTTYAYSYDAIGNITSANGTPYAYGGAGKTNPHAVTSIGERSYVYDDNGNAVGAPNQIIAYNWQNQPVSITTGKEATVFAYDEMGERFLYQTPDTAEIQVSEEYLVRGGAPEIVVKLGKTPIGLISGNDLYSTIVDHLGTPVKQVSSSGSIAESTSYGPFGEVLVGPSGKLNTKRGYTGHEEDADTGLVYAEARYYSPVAQRFFEQDPSHVYLGHQSFQELIGADRKQILADPQQLNSYSYVRNNPVTLTDPSGKIIPLLIAGGLVAWDIYDSYHTIRGPNLSIWEKAGVVGLTVADPSPGSLGAKSGKQIIKHGFDVGEVISRMGIKTKVNREVVSYGKVIGAGERDLSGEIADILNGNLKPKEVFKNSKRLLPDRDYGHYQEYVLDTPGLNRTGPERIIKGVDGEMYYTADHYKSAVDLKSGKVLRLKKHTRRRR